MPAAARMMTLQQQLKVRLKNSAQKQQKLRIHVRSLISVKIKHTTLQMATCDEIIDLNLDVLAHDELLETAKGLQKCCQDCRSENARKDEELKRVLRAASFPSSVSSSFDLKPSWIRANVDSPGDMSWYCFGERSKYRMVIVYDRSGSSLGIRDREALKGEFLNLSGSSLLRHTADEYGVIYSRLPTQRCSTVYVFVECTVSNGSSQKFRVSANARPPPGYVQHCTIHLKRLNWGTRAKVWAGQIKWLYILPNLEATKDPPSAHQLEK